jgi:DNA-binding winged helix-turn-helix (wHTH) protein
MDLLIFLVSRRDQLVSRKEIIAKLWRSDLFIDPEPNINNIIRKIRSALGDGSGKPRFLETVVGKGYRFVGPVRVIDARFPSPRSEGSAGHSEKPGGWSERSSLAVLPLLLIGKPADDHGVCLGFADALITRLGNLPGVDVLPISAVMYALSSTARFKCPRVNGVSRWKCWTPTRKTPALHESAISTSTASPNSKTKFPGRLLCH